MIPIKNYLFFCIIFVSNVFALSDNQIKKEIDSVNSLPYDFIISNLKKSIIIFSENNKKAESINYDYGSAKSLYNLNVAYYLNGEYDKSTDAVIKSINIFEKLNYVKELAFVYGSYGYQIKRRDMSKAKNYMLFGINMAEKNKLDTILVTLYNNYGVLHELNSNLDSARYFYKKSYKYALQLKDSIGIPFALNKLAGIYALEGKFKDAFANLKISDEYRNKQAGVYGRVENLAIYGEVFYLEKDYKNSIIKFKECLTQSEKYNFPPLVQYCCQQLTLLHEKINDYKSALYYQKKYELYKDSLESKEVSMKIAELEINYESEKKDRLILQNQLNINKKSQQLFLLGAVVVLLIIVSLGIYITQNEKRKRIQEELKLKNLLKEVELRKKIDDEKLRISRELHDNIGSQLTFLVSSLDNLTYLKRNEQIASKVREIALFARRTIKELRNTIWAMKHEDSDISQLILKLNEFKREINCNITGLHLEIRNNIKKSLILSSTQMLNLFRIIQEAVQNVVKHSEATKVEIEFNEYNGGFLLSISDNGKGFNIDEFSNGNGLSNMRKRCEEINGTFYLESSENGTRISCSVK